MKNLSCTLIIIVSFTISIIAQPPHAFKYQAIARNNIGEVISNQNVSLRINILHNSITGTALYVETHDVATNQFGLFNLDIGNGNVVLGIFENINWANGLHFIQIEMDVAGGSDYQLLGTSQLLSVPYSLQSRSLVLTDEMGNEYNVSIDEFGNLGANLISEWTCGVGLIDNRDEQTYNTVQIGTQCWMAENLNIGYRIDGALYYQSDNGIIEKFCYNDLDYNCDIYGGMYKWNECMQYSTTEGIQGICPPDWHMPTDEEWKKLEGEVDSQYGYPDPEWDGLGDRGYDVGLNLKSTNTWGSNGNGIDLFGFKVLPGGYRHAEEGFYALGHYSYFWTSTEITTIDSWFRRLKYNQADILRDSSLKFHANSVRCLRDNQPPSQPSSPSPADASVDQAINSILSWACSDPESDPITYDVYFGETNPPSIVSPGQTGTTYYPGTLSDSTTYYWKITVHDDHSHNTEGPVWSFSTEICYQLPSIAEAGPDQDNICIPTTLAANIPEFGTGEWSIVYGTGGIFADTTDPASQFSGIPGNTYVLHWTITNECGYTEDDMNVSFLATPPIANAGPDQSNIPSPTFIAANNPGNGTGTWIILSGTGGNITDPNNSVSSFSGVTDSSYLLRWTISTLCDTTFDEVNIVFDGCPLTVTDIDGNAYNTASIGTQCWMKENLKTITYQNGTPIPNVTDDNSWSNLTTGAYVWYNNDISWKDPYGALYNWYAVTDPNGLCPTGWHIPGEDEWTALTDFIGGIASPNGNALKSCRQVNNPYGAGCNTSEHPRWDYHSYMHGSDNYGFSGLPGGTRFDSGNFGYLGSISDWWSATEDSSSDAWIRRLKYNNGNVGIYTSDKRRGRSVRCLKD